MSGKLLFPTAENSSGKINYTTDRSVKYLIGMIIGFLYILIELIKENFG
jgi:hypothetical protein